MAQIHVVPASQDGWNVKNENAKKATAHTETKADAVKIATKIAKNQGAELVVHNGDGKIAWKNSYGNDPCPPKDNN